MIKLVKDEKILKKFKEGISVYEGLKDFYNKKCYLLVDHDLKQLRVMGVYEDYKKRRKEYDKRGLQHVIIPEFLEVINLHRKTVDEIMGLFPDYKHTKWYYE